MYEATGSRPSVWFWVISVALLLWGLAGASIYTAYFIETPEEFASSAESAANAQAYADYVENIPAWAIAVGIVAAATRLLGAICLLARRAWALPLYMVSLVFLLAAMFRAFILANVASVMRGSHIAIEVVFIVLSVFAAWFARRSRSKGILKG